MEISTIYRETRTRVEFVGWFKQTKDKTTGCIDVYFKYPGGEIPYRDMGDFLSRLERKGFKEEDIEKIYELLLSTITTEAAVASSKVRESIFQ